ncbi:MAG: thymidine phosphorylase [Bacilli bacterium]
MNIKDIIARKSKKKKLSKEEYSFVVNGFVDGSITSEDMSTFLMLIYNYGISFNEIFYLTDAMINSGNVIDTNTFSCPIIDKHSTGGVGDKVTLIITPVLASLKLYMVKMSGKSLGATGGTADKLMSIDGYNIDISLEDMIKQVNDIGCCVVNKCGDIATADKKIYALRDEIGALDSIALIASSIMSKKIALGAKYIIIDLKLGDGAFIKNKKDANVLAKYMIKLGEMYNRKVEVIITDMDCVLGNSVGNKLEVQETIDFFNGIRDKRLLELVLFICAKLYKMANKCSFKFALNEVKRVINNNEAKDKFYSWIKYQGGKIDSFEINAKQVVIKSDKSGYINSIDALGTGQIVFDLGAGRKERTDIIDTNTGIKFLKAVGDRVELGEPIAVCYYNKEIDDIVSRVRNVITINSHYKKIKDIILEVI